MAAPASDDASAAIEQLYQFGERLNESKDKSKVRSANLFFSVISIRVGSFLSSWRIGPSCCGFWFFLTSGRVLFVTRMRRTT